MRILTGFAGELHRLLKARAHAPATLKITTWNTARKPRSAVLDAVSRMNSDLVLLQEIARPDAQSVNEIWAGEDPRQGISVVSPRGVPIRLSPDHNPSLRFAVPIEVLGAKPYNVLVIWVQEDPVDYVPNLIGILDFCRPFLEGRPSVVAGDFNANPSFDSQHPKRTFGSLNSRLEALGLESAYHAFAHESHGQETKPTFYFQYNREKPFHIDYLYIPKVWNDAIKAVEVGGFDEYSGLSDHRPVTVEIADEWAR